MKKIYELACSLSALPSVSGNEDMAFDGLKKIVDGLFDEIVTLPTGCFVGIKRSKKPNAKRILLDAHLDQIGFVVNGYKGNGFVTLASVGGIDARVLCGNEVYFHTKNGTLKGVIDSTSVDSKKPIKLENLCAFTFLSKEEAKKQIPIGTPASFKTAPELLLNDKMSSPQMDDKICMVSIIMAIEQLKDADIPADIYVLFAGGEETGYIGARTGGWYCEPDYAIALDVCNCYGPDMPDWRKDCVMGNGCTVSYSATTDRRFSTYLIKTAQEKGIKYQLLGEPDHTGTDAHALAIVRSGVPTALISIPLRSMHTYTEVISLRDVKAAAELLVAAVMGLEEYENA